MNPTQTGFNNEEGLCYSSSYLRLRRQSSLASKQLSNQPCTKPKDSTIRSQYFYYIIMFSLLFCHGFERNKLLMSFVCNEDFNGLVATEKGP